MARRAATVTQADIARVIRAMKAAGLTVARVVALTDGVSVETSDAPSTRPNEAKKTVVL